jgi:hypothetical protein
MAEININNPSGTFTDLRSTDASPVDKTTAIKTIIGMTILCY